MSNEKAPEGALEVKKDFCIVLKNGTVMGVDITANIAGLQKEDLEEACSKFSQFARNFYMHLGNEIKNMP